MKASRRTGPATSFEALLRWNKPGQGWGSSGEGIPVAVNISSIHIRMLGFHEELA